MRHNFNDRYYAWVPGRMYTMDDGRQVERPIIGRHPSKAVAVEHLLDHLEEYGWPQGHAEVHDAYARVGAPDQWLVDKEGAMSPSHIKDKGVL